MPRRQQIGPRPASGVAQRSQRRDFPADCAHVLRCPTWAAAARRAAAPARTCLIVANIWPMKPSGVQLINPIVPPGRQTRTISSADALVVRREHDPDAGQHRVELSAAERQRFGIGFPPLRTRTPHVSASAAPRSNSSGTRSLAMTFAPVSAAGIAALPEPAATSSTRSPAAIAAGVHQDRTQRCHQFGGHRGVVAQRPQGAVLGFQFVVDSIDSSCHATIVGRLRRAVSSARSVPQCVHDLY